MLSRYLFHTVYSIFLTKDGHFSDCNLTSFGYDNRECHCCVSYGMSRLRHTLCHAELSVQGGIFEKLTVPPLGMTLALARQTSAYATRCD